jgi:hypothetical protein
VIRYQHHFLKRSLAELHDASPVTDRGQTRAKRFRRVQLLRLGNPSGLPLTLMGIAVTVGFFALFAWLPEIAARGTGLTPKNSLPEIQWILPVIVFMGMMFPFCVFQAAIVGWDKRLESFEQELLRPVSRGQLRNELTSALALDALPRYAIGLLLWSVMAVGTEVRVLDGWLVTQLLLVGTAGGLSLVTMKLSMVTTRDEDGVLAVIRELLVFVPLWLLGFVPVIAWPTEPLALVAGVSLHLLLAVSSVRSAHRNWCVFSVT